MTTDYRRPASSSVINESTVTGTTVTNALDTLKASITAEDTWDRGTGTLYPHTITDFVGIGTIPEVQFHVKDGDSGISPTGDIFWESSSILNHEIGFGSGGNYQLNVYESSGAQWQLVFDGSSDEFRMFNGVIGQFFVQRSSEIVINEAGSSVDFRVEGDTDINALFVKGSNNFTGMGTNTPDSKLHVMASSAGSVTATAGSTLTLESSGSNYLQFLSPNNQDAAIIWGDVADQVRGILQFNYSTDVFKFQRDGGDTLNFNLTETVINEQQRDINFRIESDTNANLFLLDAGAEFVSIGSATQYGASKLQVVTGSVNYGFSQATVNTTNATVTTIQTIAIPTNKTVMLKAKVSARRTGGASGTTGDSAYYERTVSVKDIAGTVTIGIVQTDFTYEDQTAWDVTFAVSTTNILVQVTGAASNNITWDVTTIYQECSA